MERKLFLNFLCAGVLCLAPAGVAFAQHAGGGGMPPSQNPSTTTPSQNPSTMPGQQPGANGTDTSGATVQKMDDKKFVKEAAMGGLAEVEMGKLAVQKGNSEDVKQFGQKLIDDHTKANDQLKQVASQDNIQIPTAPDKKEQEKIDKLSKLSGPAFDKAFVKDQVKDHKTDIKEFQREAQGGSEANVKTFASSTIPVLQQHLGMAENLSKTGKNGAAQPAGQSSGQ